MTDTTTTDLDPLDGDLRAKRHAAKMREAKRVKRVRERIANLLEEASPLGIWDFSLEVDHIRDGYVEATLYDNRDDVATQASPVRIHVEVLPVEVSA